MKPSITGQKRPIDLVSGAEYRASKRQHSSADETTAATQLLGFSDPRYQTLSPAAQEALCSVNHALQGGGTLLDLSHLDAAALTDLPVALIHPAIHAVQTLILPAGLTRLPSFCQNLAALQRLDVPNFAGGSIDARGMSSLRELQGSARGNFRYIYLNTLAEVRFQAPAMASKIRIYRFNHEQRMVQSHALPSHGYFKVLPGYIYPDFASLNGETVFYGTTTRISCNTIAPEILHRRLSSQAKDWKSRGYFGITDSASLSRTLTVGKEEQYKKALENSERYALVSDTKFAEWLCKQFDAMLTDLSSPFRQPPNNDRCIRGMRVFSSNHEMHLVLIVKKRPVMEFIAEFYDPNLSRTHKRKVANRLEEITDPQRPWRLNDFTDPLYVEAYMRGAPSLLLSFANVGQRKPGHPVDSEFWLAESDWSHPDIMFTLVDMQLASQIRPYWTKLLVQYEKKELSLSNLFTVLDGHCNNTVFPFTCPATKAALYANNLSTVDEITACIASFAAVCSAAPLADQQALPEHALRKLLSPVESWSQMLTDISPDNKAGLRQYLILANRLLNQAQLAANDVIALLSATNHAGLNAIGAALATNDPESLKLLGTLVTSLVRREALSAVDAIALIGGSQAAPGLPNSSSDTWPVVWHACAHNSAALVSELSTLLVGVGKRGLAEEAQSSLSCVFADLPDPSDDWFDTAFWGVNSPEDLLGNPEAQTDPDRRPGLAGTLQRVIFGDADPDAAPSLICSHPEQAIILANIRQLAQSLLDNELLSYFDGTGVFMAATAD